jgi:Anti-sigma factor NepR
MNISGLDLSVTRGVIMEFTRNPVISAVVASRCITEPELPPESVEHQILDFLDGRTDGENLLHTLYDHVLDEPIPERIRSLLTK